MITTGCYEYYQFMHTGYTYNQTRHIPNRIFILKGEML